jgi:Flp pilus assembly protein TadG
MKRQRGAATVEFAIIGLLFFMLLFGIIEFGRAFFTYNTLLEATRRGARVAAVCPVSSGGISYVKQVTMFNTPTASPPSSGLLGLTANNIRVKYYNSNMTTVLSSDSGPFPTTTWDTMYQNIAFVEVSLTPQNSADAFKHALYIPLFSHIFNVGPQTDGSHSAITTVLPSASLGRIGNSNPVTKRCCPGSNYAAAQACTTSSPPP